MASLFARELAKANINPRCSLKAANPSIIGTLDITVNAETQTMYVGTQYSATSEGSEITVPFQQQAFLFTSETLDPDNFFKPNLVGGTIEWDVDLS